MPNKCATSAQSEALHLGIIKAMGGTKYGGTVSFNKGYEYLQANQSRNETVRRTGNVVMVTKMMRL